jgi:hypothetical protein
VYISEVLSVPGLVDWDGDSVSDEGDEWIELHNGSARAVNVGGWRLDLGDGGQAHRIPRGTVLRAGAYLALFQRQTGLALDDMGGQIRLLDARGRLVEGITFAALAPDSSQSRDAAGRWRTDYPPSPGTSNLPAQPAGTTPAGATPATPTVR